MLSIHSGDFEGARLRVPGVVGAVVAADWCGYCRRFLPHFERAVAAFPGTLAVVDVSDDESPLWDELRVRVVPTLILFRDGVPVWRKDGRLGVGLSPGDLTLLAEAATAAG